MSATATLTDLAARANTEHAAFEVTQSAAIEHAIAAGEALVEAKTQLAHGEWLPWLETHFEASADTAGNYMKVARNSERVRNLGSVRQALAEVAGKRPKPAPPNEHRKHMSVLFDKLMAERDRIRYVTGPDLAYVPQARDPHYFLTGALVDGQRFIKQVEALGELPPPGARSRDLQSRKEEAEGLLKGIRRAADRLERTLNDERPAARRTVRETSNRGSSPSHDHV